MKAPNLVMQHVHENLKMLKFLASLDISLNTIEFETNYKQLINLLLTIGGKPLIKNENSEHEVKSIPPQHTETKKHVSQCTKETQTLPYMIIPQTNNSPSEDYESILEEPISEDEKLISEDHELVSEDEELVSEDEESIFEDEESISEDGELVSEDEESISEDEESISEESISEDEESISEDEESISEDEELVSEDEESIFEEEESAPEEEELILEENNIVPSEYIQPEMALYNVNRLLCDIGMNYNAKENLDIINIMCQQSMYPNRQEIIKYIQRVNGELKCNGTKNILKEHIIMVELLMANEPFTYWTYPINQQILSKYTKDELDSFHRYYHEFSYTRIIHDKSALICELITCMNNVRQCRIYISEFF